MRYNQELNDDACHAHVLDARRTGIEWADTEWGALTDEQSVEQATAYSWNGALSDARAMMRNFSYFYFPSSLENQDERLEELATICLAAAKDRWQQLCDEQLR